MWEGKLSGDFKSLQYFKELILWDYMELNIF